MPWICAYIYICVCVYIYNVIYISLSSIDPFEWETYMNDAVRVIFVIFIFFIVGIKAYNPMMQILVLDNYRMFVLYVHINVIKTWIHRDYNQTW